MKIWKNIDLIGTSELYKDLLDLFLDVYYKVSALKEKVGNNLAPDYYDCSQRFEIRLCTTHATTKDDKEVKKYHGKILIRSKPLIRLPLLLSQIKAKNNSFKLKKEIRQILYILYRPKKSSEHFTTT